MIANLMCASVSQLSLHTLARWKMSSGLWAVGWWRPSDWADCSTGLNICWVGQWMVAYLVHGALLYR